MIFKIDKMTMTELLKGELKEYEAFTLMSEEERQALHDGVSCGNSVYKNGPCYSQENGGPMSFLDAYKYNKDALQALETGGDNNA